MNLQELFHIALQNHKDLIFCYGNVISDLNKVNM